MKRYLLFRGDIYYPAGGWDDFKGSFDTLVEAAEEATKDSSFDWWHVVDSHTGIKEEGDN